MVHAVALGESLRRAGAVLVPTARMRSFVTPTYKVPFLRLASRYTW
jgi:hypothetical protein